MSQIQNLSKIKKKMSQIQKSPKLQKCPKFKYVPIIKLYWWTNHIFHFQMVPIGRPTQFWAFQMADQPIFHLLNDCQPHI